MKFGSVDDPSGIDFTLPPDHQETGRVLNASKFKGRAPIYIGCAKWNRQDLKKFYPRGTKDELAYYSTQFNSIELNATFYNSYDASQVATWRDKTPEGFKFFPKINQVISHFKRLNEAKVPTEEFVNSMAAFDDRLGVIFLQLHNNFGPKNYDRLEKYLQDFPKGVPLAVELRHADWFPEAGEEISSKVFDLVESLGMLNVIVDTAGRRDMLHMRLTTPSAFIRYVGANHPSDIERLDDWFERIKKWLENGIEAVYFFVHQNLEKESPWLSAHLIKRLNEELGYDLKVPDASPQTDLFKEQ